MKQQKELIFTEINLFKNELLTSLTHNTTFHSNEPSSNTNRIIFLLQHQIEFLQEQLKSKDTIINSIIENLSRNGDVFFAKGSNTENSWKPNKLKATTKHKNHRKQGKPKKHSSMLLQ